MTCEEWQKTEVCPECTSTDIIKGHMKMGARTHHIIRCSSCGFERDEV